MWNSKVRAVGHSSGIILPKEACKSLDVRQGDAVSLVRTETGLELRAGSSEPLPSPQDSRQVPVETTVNSES